MPGVAVCLDLACGKAQGSVGGSETAFGQGGATGLGSRGIRARSVRKGKSEVVCSVDNGRLDFWVTSWKFVPFDSAIEKKSIYTLNY
jgi:hypothetical protein